jgi:Flp pilus assembly protein TadG
MTRFPSLRRPRRSLLRDESGLQLIEFALALPVVLALGFTGVETANYALTHLKVSQISQTVSDNAARVTTRIDESDIHEVFTGAVQISPAMNFRQNGRIVLSSLQDNGQTGTRKGQMINWQRCTGSLAVLPAYGTQNKGRNDATLQGMGPTGRQIQSLPNTAVMFVEVSYRYQPLIPGVMQPRTIRYESAFNVRERTEQNITNSKSLTVNAC